MEKYGLIGYPLGHSFSKNYFNQKFVDENMDAVYENYEIATIDSLLEIVDSNPELRGLNVTIPYKEKVISFLDNISPEARAMVMKPSSRVTTPMSSVSPKASTPSWKAITRKLLSLALVVHPRPLTSVLRALVLKPFLSAATSVPAPFSIPTSLLILSRNTMSLSTALHAECIPT